MPNIVQPVPFNNGAIFPQLGLGTYRAKGNESYEAVKHALKLGYRHFDTAMFYQNEKEVGKAIADGMKEYNISRTEIRIVTKLLNTCNRPSMVVPCLKESLKNLNMNYVDLYLIHSPVCLMPFEDGVVGLKEKCDENDQPMFDDIQPKEIWKAMEECVQLGLASSIGVSNFNSQQVKQVIDHCTIKPVTNQVECHPCLPQNELRQFCLNQGVVLSTFRSLGGQVKRQDNPDMLNNKNVLNIALKHDRTPAQVLLRWQIENGHVVLVKSANESRLQENLDIFNFALDEDDMKQLATMDCGYRCCPYLNSVPSKQYPFNIEY